MTVDQWAAKNRTHPNSSGVPGPRDPYLTPYIVEPSRAVASGRSKRIIFASGAQEGKTEMLLDIAGHRLDQRPAPILYVGPNKQFLSEQFEPRVMGLLDGASTLAMKIARGKSMTKTRKTVGGVPFRLAHAGSSAALKSDPAALVMVDEYDEMGGDVQGQGGVLGLVELRGSTYADFVCVVTSTPSKGRVEAIRDPTSGLIFWDVADVEELESPIWNLWQQGSRHHWCWPCPHCEEYFVPRFDLLRWPKTATPMEAAREVFMECPSCHGVIENDLHKTAMNERGRYVAPGQSVDKAGNLHGVWPEKKSLSYWVSGLASPFVTWGERISAYLEAVAMGDDTEIQAAVNGGFGEVYSPGVGDVADWQELKLKSSKSLYKRGEVNEDALLLALTVDVQKQSLPWVVRAWGPRATSWLVDYGHIRGDTAEEEVWDVLAEMCGDTWDGMPIRIGLVDSGFRPGKTDTLPINRVYEFCRRMGKRIRATKGSSTPMRTPLLFSKLEVNRKGKSSKYGLDYVRLDTDHWKSWVHERIRWEEDRPGAWMLPQGCDDDYCRQVVGEVRVKQPTGRPEWIERGRHHDFLDCEAMQAAAGYILNVQRVPMPPTPKNTGLPKPTGGDGGPPPLQNGDAAATDGDGRKPETLDEVLTERPREDSTRKVAPQKVLHRRVRRVYRSSFLG